MPREKRRISHRSTLALILAILVLSALTIVGIERKQSRHKDTSTPCTATVGTTTVSLELEQGENATTIAAIGKKLSLPNHAVTIALATAMQESDLHNINYGDRDSVGLFQQRPSQGWGTTKQLLSPQYAAAAFYQRLENVRNWQNLSVTDAAQSVQRSAAPNAYAQWEPQARVLAQALTGEIAAAFQCKVNVNASDLSDKTLSNAMHTDLGAGNINVTISDAKGWLTASWLVGHARHLGVQTVRFHGYYWTAKSGTWRQVNDTEPKIRINT